MSIRNTLVFFMRRCDNNSSVADTNSSEIELSQEFGFVGIGKRGTYGIKEILQRLCDLDAMFFGVLFRGCLSAHGGCRTDNARNYEYYDDKHGGYDLHDLSEWLYLLVHRNYL